MAKFYFFEKIVQLFYTHVFTEPKETYAKTTQLGVTFGSGYLAGVVCAIVSHPADSLVSQLSKAANKGKSMGTIASEVGIVTLATKGLGTRVIMIGEHYVLAFFGKRTCLICCVLGTLTGFQWWIYDSFKSVMGLGTTGGK
jgi:solute carrier family 25 (mitochondrial phosphate transporter), member 3